MTDKIKPTLAEIHSQEMGWGELPERKEKPDCEACSG